MGLTQSILCSTSCRDSQRVTRKSTAGLLSHPFVSGLIITVAPYRSHYKFGRTLGAGTYGIVREADSSKGKVAIKIILKKNVRGNEQMVYDELEMLQALDHPNIVHFVDWFESKVGPCIRSGSPCLTGDRINSTLSRSWPLVVSCSTEFASTASSPRRMPLRLSARCLALSTTCTSATLFIGVCPPFRVPGWRGH